MLAEMLALGVWKCAISECLMYKDGSGWRQNKKKDGTFRRLQVRWRKEEKKFCELQRISRKACSIPWCFFSTLGSQSKVLCELGQAMPGWPLWSTASYGRSASSEKYTHKSEDLLKIWYKKLAAKFPAEMCFRQASSIEHTSVNAGLATRNRNSQFEKWQRKLGFVPTMPNPPFQMQLQLCVKMQRSCC